MHHLRNFFRQTQGQEREDALGITPAHFEGQTQLAELGDDVGTS